MTSRPIIALLPLALLMASACARSAEEQALEAADAIGTDLAAVPPDEAPRALSANASPDLVDAGATAPACAGASGPCTADSLEEELEPEEQDPPRDAAPAPESELEAEARPPVSARSRPPADAPTTSVNPNRPAPEVEAGGGADPLQAPSPNVDLSFQGKPLFIENDPLETSGVPICVVFIRGLEACWPKLDPEVRELTEELLTEAVNLARSLRRPFVRERACEMGWELATGAFAPRCPGVFPVEKPPTVRDD